MKLADCFAKLHQQTNPDFHFAPEVTDRILRDVQRMERKVLKSGIAEKQAHFAAAKQVLTGLRDATTRDLESVVQALANARATKLASPAVPAPTQDAPAQPSPAGPEPIGPDVQAAIDADPVVETSGATESASAQPATPFAERQQDPVAEGALHERETELLRRLESKRRETRENAERELMSRKGLPWTNKPEQAEMNARYTEELRARVQEREARWTNEAEQLAEEAGIEVTADNIPFSQNKIAPEPIAQAVKETMELLGVGPDVVTAEVVPDAEAIEDTTERTAVMSSKKAGNNVRAYYMSARNGKPARVVVNAAGVRTPEQARIAVLHEVAGHHGLRVLFTKAQGKWRGIVDRLYNRLSNGELSQDVQRETGVRTLRELQELYHRPAVGMNYDPTTVEGRSNLIEEVLATMAPFAKKPAWYQSILSELKTLLNRITGGMLGRSFTDADVNVLLAKARKAARKTAKTGRVSNDTGAKMAQGVPETNFGNTQSNDIRFSQERAERDARSVERALVASASELKEFATQKKAKADEKVPDAVKQTLNGVYAIYTDAQALADAEAWINNETGGADAVERTIMGDNRAQLDGRDVAAAKIILQRHSAMGLNTRYTDLLRSVMGKMNTQAQGLQKMHLLFDTTTPEGALAHFQREVEKVVEQLSDKNKEQAKIIQGLLGMLEQFKADAATSRIVVALRTIATSADLTPARKAEIQDKMRNALVNDDGTDTTRVRLRGLFIAAGVEVKAADKMAVQLLEKFRAAQKKGRAKIIKGMLKVPKIVKRIPKGQFAKWEKLNEEGVLSDAKMFSAIANKFGFPVFTSDDAATIRGFFDKYNATSEPLLKFVQGAKLLEWVESRTNPAGIIEKYGTLYTLGKLTSFKTIERNIIGNVLVAITRSAAIDVPIWLGEKGLSLFTGKRVAPLQTAIQNMISGQKQVNAMYRLARDYAIAQGADRVTASREGFDALLTAARYHMAGYRDAGSLKNVHRSVFSSAAGKMFEKVMHGMLTLPDLGRFYGEVNAELARLMHAAGPGTVLPTSEMYEAAYTHAQRELYLDKNNLTESLGYIVKGLNFGLKFGVGNVALLFVRVPANILKLSVTFSPLGVVRAIYNASPRLGNDPRMAVRNLMTAIAGTGALIPAGAWLYGLGIITAAEDEDDDIARVQRASGWQKYAINLSMLNRRRISGNWHTKEPIQKHDTLVSFAWAQPVAFSLAAGAELQRKHDIGEAAEGSWAMRNLLEPAGSGMEAFMDQPMVTGLSMLMNDISKAKDEGIIHGLRPVIRALDFVPTILRDFRYLRDNSVPETRDSNPIVEEFSKIITGIPYADLVHEFPKRYNVLGEAEERYQAGSNTFLNVFFNPSMTKFVRENKVASEVIRLAQQTDSKSGLPKQVDKSVQINTTGMPGAAQTLKLTNEDISNMQRIQGRLFVELATLQMNRPDYFLMTDHQRAKLMANALGASQTAAKAVLFRHVPATLMPYGPVINKDAVFAISWGKIKGIIP